MRYDKPERKKKDHHQRQKYCTIAPDENDVKCKERHHPDEVLRIWTGKQIVCEKRQDDC